MAKRDRSRGGKRGAAPEEARPPEKPEAARYAVVSLYASSCITLCFLVMNGELQFYECQAAGLRMAMAALAVSALSCAVDALAGFVLSRGVPWIRRVVPMSAAVSLAALAASFSEVVVDYPAFFVARTLSFLMEAVAVLLVLRPSSKAWFAALERADR